jgi:hypothetical protein
MLLEVQHIYLEFSITKNPKDMNIAGLDNTFIPAILINYFRQTISGLFRI